MRQFEHALRFCKFDSGEKKRKKGTQFLMSFGVVISQFSADDAVSRVVVGGASSRAPTSYKDGVSRAPCSTFVFSLSLIPTLRNCVYLC